MSNPPRAPGVFLKLRRLGIGADILWRCVVTGEETAHWLAIGSRVFESLHRLYFGNRTVVALSRSLNKVQKYTIWILNIRTPTDASQRHLFSGPAVDP